MAHPLCGKGGTLLRKQRPLPREAPGAPGSTVTAFWQPPGGPLGGPRTGSSAAMTHGKTASGSRAAPGLSLRGPP
eukprot:1766772-Alexandrium_andersonii.AAC.1